MPPSSNTVIVAVYVVLFDVGTNSIHLIVVEMDPRFGTSQTQLTNIVRAEPDPSLFQVPAGYTVTKERGDDGARDSAI